MLQTCSGNVPGSDLGLSPTMPTAAFNISPNSLRGIIQTFYTVQPELLTARPNKLDENRDHLDILHYKFTSTNMFQLIAIFIFNSCRGGWLDLEAVPGVRAFVLEGSPQHASNK
jgi:hypothetical protein